MFPSESSCERKAAQLKRRSERFEERRIMFELVCDVYEKKHRGWWASALVPKTENHEVFNQQRSTGRVNHCLEG